MKQGMYFAFFGKLPVSVLSPYQLDDKTFVEYHADPSAKVTLYYALDAGLGNQVKYQTEPLRDLYEGILQNHLHCSTGRHCGIILNQ